MESGSGSGRMPVPSSIERANRVLFFWGAITGGVQSMAKHNAYTMRDVARLADVSVSTVSAVVNDKGVVSPELTKRVEQAIEAVGFYPNRGARGLRTGRTFIVGLVVPDATNPFFVEVMRGVEDEALRNGYEVIVCNSNDNLNLERTLPLRVSSMPTPTATPMAFARSLSAFTISAAAFPIRQNGPATRWRIWLKAPASRWPNRGSAE